MEDALACKPHELLKKSLFTAPYKRINTVVHF